MVVSRKHIHATTKLGDKVADRLAQVIGSWRFVLGQNWFVLIWIAWNSTPGLPHFDPFPFILLNLLFSWQASNTGPVLQMTGNRSAAKDRMRDDTEASEVQELYDINKTQLEILRQQSEILDLLKQGGPHELP